MPLYLRSFRLVTTVLILINGVLLALDILPITLLSQEELAVVPGVLVLGLGGICLRLYWSLVFAQTVTLNGSANLGEKNVPH